MTVTWAPRVKRNDTWILKIHLGHYTFYRETFHGTSWEAKQRELALKDMRESLQPASPKPEMEPEADRIRNMQPHLKRISYDGRGYNVIWGGVTPQYEKKLQFLNKRSLRPDLVMALDERTERPTQKEMDRIIEALIKELKFCTGREWVIPKDVIDWGEW